MMQDSPSVITRFAPSPTGMLHIGGARTALFNWLYARSRGGHFLLRIEDTDKTRSTQEAIYAIVKGLAWLGLHHDGEIVYQSDRYARHQEAAQALLDSGQAYHCYCSAEELQVMRAEQRAAGLQIRYNSLWRDRNPREAPPDISPTLRLKTSREGQTTIQDAIQGLVAVDHSELDDMILLRSDKTPTYVFSSVVDDHDMGITHVIRGDDHLTNSFRQWQIYDAFGWQPPVFAHQPLIHGPDGTKLSKRHGDVLSIENYQRKGYLPEAMRNYLLRLGWGHGNEEIIEEARALKLFDLPKIGRSPARYDPFKLDYFNAHYIKARQDNELTELIQPWLEEPLDSIKKARLEQAMVYLKPRARNLVQLADHARFLIASRPISIEEKAQSWLQGHGYTCLAEVRHILANLSDWQTKTLENALRAHADSSGYKLSTLAQPLRAALTGSRVSPGIFEIATVLGREESLARIDDVL